MVSRKFMLERGKIEKNCLADLKVGSRGKMIVIVKKTTVSKDFIGVKSFEAKYGGDIVKGYIETEKGTGILTVS